MVGDTAGGKEEQEMGGGLLVRLFEVRWSRAFLGPMLSAMAFFHPRQTNQLCACVYVCVGGSLRYRLVGDCLHGFTNTWPSCMETTQRR